MQDAWVWRPVTSPLTGDLHTLRDLRAEGWQRVDTQRDPLRVIFLASQLADVRQVEIPGRAEREVWAHRDDLARTDATPVILAFRPPRARVSPIARCCRC
jgi:hypothetical protein